MITVKFNKICKTTQGVQVPRSKQLETPKDGYVRYLYINDFCSDDSCKYIENKFPNKIVNDNDLVMANTGSPGRVFLGKDGILSNNLFKISFDNESIDKNYLFMILGSLQFQERLQDQMKQGIQKHLGHKTIARQEIPLPPLPVQQKIASILDTADGLKQKDKALITKYDELCQSLFLDMFGDPVTNPKDFKIVTLEEVTSKITDGVHAKPEYTENGVPFISVKDITTGKLIFDKCKYISEESHMKYSKRCNPEYQDILYTKVGATYGRPAIVDTEKEFSLYVSVALIKPKKKLINPFFLKEAMANPAVKRQADRSIKGIGVPDLHLNMIKKFVVPLPEMSQQQEFSERVRSIEQLKQQAQASLQKSEDLFNCLLQKAFKGELI